MSTPWSTRRAAKRLAGAVTDRLGGPVSSRWLCEELCRAMSRQRGGRPIELRYVDFPPGTVTGLALVRDDGDIILVDRRRTGVQQLVILGHELRHLTQDGHDHHLGGAAAAARMLRETGDIERHLWDEVLHAAARSHCEDAYEQDAEDFGLELGRRLLPWVDDGQNPGSGPRDELLGRIQTSLGPR